MGAPTSQRVADVGAHHRHGAAVCHGLWAQSAPLQFVRRSFRRACALGRGGSEGKTRPRWPWTSATALRRRPTL